MQFEWDENKRKARKKEREMYYKDMEAEKKKNGNGFRETKSNEV